MRYKFVLTLVNVTITKYVLNHKILYSRDIVFTVEQNVALMKEGLVLHIVIAKLCVN